MVMKKTKEEQLHQLDRLFYKVDETMCHLYKVDPHKLDFHAGGNHRKGVYVWYRDIMRQADAKGFLPEVLVDEDYYFNKCQMAPYRLAFHIGRQYPTLGAFYEALVAGHQFAPGVTTVKDLLRGCLYAIRDARFWVIDKICRLAGVPMAYLFTPYRRRGQDSAFGKLVDIVAGLKDCDVAALAGFAKLLAGGKVEIDDVAALLAWRDTIYDEEETGTGEVGIEKDD